MVMDLKAELNKLVNDDDTQPGMELNEETPSQEISEEPAEEIQEEVIDESQPAEIEEVPEQVVPDNEDPVDWAPSLKYSHLKKEMDFPEWTHELVKSKELESEFKDLLEKAQGLDFSKAKREELENQIVEKYEPAFNEGQKLASEVNAFNEGVRSENIADNYYTLKSIGLDDEKIKDLARHVLQAEKLDPQQRAAFDNQFQAKNQLTEYETKLSNMQYQLNQTEVAAAEARFDGFLDSRADIAKEYESRDGNGSGDFKADFMSYGIAQEAKTGRQMEWKDALKSFKKIHGLGRAKAKPSPVKRNVPNLNSTGHSPIEKQIDSIQEFEKIFDSLG